MAGASLLTLLDDIAAVLDDIAVMTKVAAKKTAGVLGDDLALNAQQVSGVRADRELPVVWAVAKGSFKNKLILVPAALLISAFIPWAVTPLLMIGGLYLCFEGFEKLAHKFLHSKDDDASRHEERMQAVANPEVDMLAFEKEKVKGAIRTDFILSAEIIAIALGTVAAATFSKQAAVLATVAIAMTIGVYGLVAAIVKMDDAGLYLTQRKDSTLLNALGRGLLITAPYLMKTLSVVGTAAMFMVGGGILTHGIPAAHHWIEGVTQSVAQHSSTFALVTPTLLNLIAGVIAGALALLAFSILSRLWRAVKPTKAAS
ncbi:DUF808 domain-containing protein [Ectopseudomonas mendocina]|uniref:DUF808 domain-containing protein n=1 Tax=Ectopseudomonas mendocina TaxID=300 RepID=A0ABZ2RLR4_ECTME